MDIPGDADQKMAGNSMARRPSLLDGQAAPDAEVALMHLRHVYEGRGARRRLPAVGCYAGRGACHPVTWTWRLHGPMMITLGSQAQPTIGAKIGRIIRSQPKRGPRRRQMPQVKKQKQGLIDSESRVQPRSLLHTCGATLAAAGLAR